MPHSGPPSQISEMLIQYLNSNLFEYALYISINLNIYDLLFSHICAVTKDWTDKSQIYISISATLCSLSLACYSHSFVTFLLKAKEQCNRNIEFRTEYKYIFNGKFHQIRILNIFNLSKVVEWKYRIYSFLANWSNTNIE